MTPDPRPSIAELQRLCRDDTANHDADLALAAPVFLEIAAAALEWQKAVRARCDYGTAAYASDPFSILTEDFTIATDRLDATADGLLRGFLSALSKVSP